MSDELKPCPFCGGDAKTHQPRGRAKHWRISCIGNFDCPGLFMDKRFASEADAAAAWNTRALDPAGGE